MTNALAELEKIKELLEIELQEDREFYRTRVLNQALGERKKQGLCWYPVQATERGYSKGGNLYVVYERTSQIDESHQFSMGGSVALFKNTGGKEKDNPTINGIITTVRPNKLKIQFPYNDPPDWLFDSHVGIDIMFDEISYREMKIALEKVQKADEKSRVGEFREIIYGNIKPQLKDGNLHTSIYLNDSQNDALNLVLNSLDVALIHGPPGTGKTTTLVESIIATVKKEKQVMVTAPSNTAIDLITDKLHKRGIRVVRLGNPARISDDLFLQTLDSQMSEHPDSKNLKVLQKKAQEYRRLAGQYKRNFGRDEREQRKLLVDEARAVENEIDHLEFYIEEDILNSAEVITCTLVGSGGRILKDRKFKTVFIDEAGQALEPATWIPILKAGKIVLAGDHKQLPPTVKSMKAMKLGFGESLFEKLIVKHKSSAVMLETQYRMHEQIMTFPGKELYHSGLIAADMVKNRVLSIKDEWLSTPFEYIDTAGCGFNDQKEKENASTYNPEEADLLLKHFNKLFSIAMEKAPEMFNRVVRIGIISPYKAQVNYLKEIFLTGFSYPEYLPNIHISTIDGFQGQERDIIYISLVRSNDNQEIGFLSDIRRMNVALTRAKMKLVVFGDSATITSNPFYDRWMQYAESVGGYKSAWELDLT